jgi:hypothetical protein
MQPTEITIEFDRFRFTGMVEGEVTDWRFVSNDPDFIRFFGGNEVTTLTIDTIGLARGFNANLFLISIRSAFRNIQ